MSPTAHLSYLLPQSPGLRGPRLIPSEKVVSRLWLLTLTRVGLLYLVVEVRSYLRMLRQELVVVIGKTLPQVTEALSSKDAPRRKPVSSLLDVQVDSAWFGL